MISAKIQLPDLAIGELKFIVALSCGLILQCQRIHARALSKLGATTTASEASETEERNRAWGWNGAESECTFTELHC